MPYTWRNSTPKMRVNAPSSYVRSRQQWIMEQMRGLGGTALLKELQVGLQPDNPESG